MLHQASCEAREPYSSHGRKRECSSYAYYPSAVLQKLYTVSMELGPIGYRLNCKKSNACWAAPKWGW